jgi:hypothetical protein
MHKYSTHVVSSIKYKLWQGRNALVLSLLTMAFVVSPEPAISGTSAIRSDQASDAARQLRTAPVLSSQERPFGFSLDDAARLFAAFNVSDRSGSPPNSPFQLLYENSAPGSGDFAVAPDTYLYVPLLYNDNVDPVIGHFPDNARNRQKVLRYWYSQNEFGVTTMQVSVDAKVVSLGAGYVSGLSFRAPLADGATQYLSAAAFIAPLKRGSHVVEIYIKATGDALRDPPFDQYFPDGFWEYSATYNVTVR